MRTFSLDALLSPDPSSPRVNTGLLVLRLFVGVAFLFHGYGKVVDIPAFMADFGLPMPLAVLAAYGQVVAGALLITGLLTHAAAMFLAGTMGVATAQLIARGETFIDPHAHTWEASSFYFVTTLAIVLLGPGTLSLDMRLWGRRAPQRRHARAVVGFGE